MHLSINFKGLSIPHILNPELNNPVFLLLFLSVHPALSQSIHTYTRITVQKSSPIPVQTNADTY